MCQVCKITRPSYGLIDGKASHCAQCKTNDMFNVVSKKCFCLKAIPSFGLKDGNPTHCMKCRTTDMFNVINKMCFCGKSRPSFGLKDGKSTHCMKCRTTDILDVTHQMCFCGKSRPSFGLKDGKSTHCNKCRTTDMINVNDKDRKCFCLKSRPSFGLKDQKASHCSQCKTTDMFNVKDKKCFCLKSRPNFGLKDGKASHCIQCKTNDMIDVNHNLQLCSQCKITRANRKYKGLCLRCFVYLNPDEPNSRNYKIKEKHVTDFIQEQFSSIPMIFDKQIQDGCSKRRPDVLIQLLTHNVIIEVDEQQHGNYDTLCEQARLNNLFEDLQHIPLILIRFNPDSYKNNGIKVVSCFKTENKSNCLIIRDKQLWIDRLEKLKETIQWSLNVMPDEPLVIKQLFFDA